MTRAQQRVLPRLHAGTERDRGQSVALMEAVGMNIRGIPYSGGTCWRLLGVSIGTAEEQFQEEREETPVIL